MKLIIDIPEEIYNHTQEYEVGGFNQENDTKLFMAIKNGIPLEEELEKIKHEIGKEFVDLQDGSEEWRSYVNEAVLSCYEIVEKYISEMRGEKTNSKGVLEQIAEEQKTLSDSLKAWSKALEHGDIY